MIPHRAESVHILGAYIYIYIYMLNIYIYVYTYINIYIYIYIYVFLLFKGLYGAPDSPVPYEPTVRLSPLLCSISLMPPSESLTIQEASVCCV